MVRVLVTGAGGFVGRTLIENLVAAGASVTAVDFNADTLIDHPTLQRIAGDIANQHVRRAALAEPCQALIHLATVPGGAAEANPAASRRINIDAMYNLLDDFRTTSGAAPRVVFASSIAVFGDPLPVEGVDDNTPLAPRLIYAGHKAMMETALAMMSRRGEIDGITLRLPAVLARPSGSAAMKSAFMSDVFHALRDGHSYVCPISARATLWLQSVDCCSKNLMRALGTDATLLPPTRAVTLPALHVSMEDLVAEIARQTNSDPALVVYKSDPALEAAFGTHPPLVTSAAERAGFVGDESLSVLVSSALRKIAPSQ